MKVVDIKKVGRLTKLIVILVYTILFAVIVYKNGIPAAVLMFLINMIVVGIVNTVGFFWESWDDNN